MNWKSKFFPDFTYIEEPRDPPPYDEELRAYIGVKSGYDGEVFDWPALRVERAALRMWKEFDIQDVTGSRIEHHMIRYLCHLIPSLEADPWFQEKVWSFYDTRQRKRKVTNWFGSQNSGKTTSMAAIAIGLGCLHPEFTRQTASGPYKDAGESPLWNAMEETFDEVRATWGDQLARWTGGILDPKTKTWRSNEKKTTCLMKATSSKGTLTFSEAPKAGTLKLVAMDEVGKVQGAKAKDRKQEDGYFIIYLDEIGAGYPTMKILQALHNLRSNRNFHMFTGCNPFNPVGQLDGELGRPARGYESLKIDEDYVWVSGEGSITYRFDGLQSPNMVLHTNKWPWLFNEERHDQLLSGTQRDSDFYNSQCRAFMNIGSGNRYVLNVPDIKAGMVDQPFEWTHEEKWRAAFLDPGLSTDGDAAVLTILEGGNQRLPSGDTSPITYASKQVTIPIFTGMIADAAWVAKTREVRGHAATNNPEVGDLVPVEEQLAVNTGWHLALEGVPRGNFGYDDSMRSKVMEAMTWALGDGPKAVSSVGDPEDTPMYPPKWEVDPGTNKRTLVTWKMDCQKFVSQVWFLGAAVVRSGHFRCHPSTMVALNQATQRFWNYAAGGRKRVVESKKEMKERNRGASPDEADSLFGAIYIAHRKGLLKLRINMPEATEHLTLRSKKPPTSFIQRQWKTRRPTTGLNSTGTRG
jgi:hypothetical protein